MSPPNAMTCVSKYRRLHNTICTTAIVVGVNYDIVIQCQSVWTCFFLSVFFSASWRNILRTSRGIPLLGSAPGPRWGLPSPRPPASAPPKPKSWIRPWSSKVPYLKSSTHILMFSWNFDLPSTCTKLIAVSVGNMG